MHTLRMEAEEGPDKKKLMSSLAGYIGMGIKGGFCAYGISTKMAISFGPRQEKTRRGFLQSKTQTSLLSCRD